MLSKYAFAKIAKLGRNFLGRIVFFNLRRIVNLPLWTLIAFRNQTFKLSILSRYVMYISQKFTVSVSSFTVRRPLIAAVQLRQPAGLWPVTSGIGHGSQASNATLPNDVDEGDDRQRRVRDSRRVQHQQHGHEVKDGQIRTHDVQVVCARAVHHQIRNGHACSAEFCRKPDPEGELQLHKQQVASIPCDQIKIAKVYKSCPKMITLENDRFWHPYKNYLRMWGIWAN